MTKYNSKKVTHDGIEFDSKDEGLYYLYLQEKLEKKEILGFSTQPKYILIDKFEKDGKKYRATTYTPDFRIFHKDGSHELIDVKGFSTQQGDLRRKLFDSRYTEKLTWVTRNLKHGDKDGWIEYEDLKRARKKKTP
jgi:hypothetical protein